MNLIQWATSPWGEQVPSHISWTLLYVSAIAGVLFLIVHAIYVAATGKSAAAHAEISSAAPAVNNAQIPERVARHSFGARAFHGIMALSMLALLFTAFLPKVGVQFAWVKWHWIAGVVLTISVIYHIIHASFVLDFWSIWPDAMDVEDAKRRMNLAMGKPSPEPRKFAKYPLENKLYHLIVMLAGLAAIGTGLFMMKRVQTPFFTRNPYLFGDMTWGWMYVLHGLAGVGFVALVTVHIYFAIRPEKLFITKSMIFGWITRDQYLEHHDPNRWPAVAESKKASF
ncbi:MAG TPA: cytochrome b/b6 domain-containing protein [Candidatus Saccharimonadales bacterium]|nr:cytochrome b/b6 domain-containing protein [Candidatus Saccharimonadales bacterium]